MTESLWSMRGFGNGVLVMSFPIKVPGGALGGFFPVAPAASPPSESLL